jgi:hypothetical protein
MDNFTPADFSEVYDYLEYLFENNMEVDWGLVEGSAIYADLMLIRIMYMSKNGLLP